MAHRSRAAPRPVPPGQGAAAARRAPRRRPPHRRRRRPRRRRPPLRPPPPAPATAPETRRRRRPTTTEPPAAAHLDGRHGPGQGRPRAPGARRLGDGPDPLDGRPDDRQPDRRRAAGGQRAHPAAAGARWRSTGWSPGTPWRRRSLLRRRGPRGGPEVGRLPGTRGRGPPPADVQDRGRARGGAAGAAGAARS